VGAVGRDRCRTGLGDEGPLAVRTAGGALFSIQRPATEGCDQLTTEARLMTSSASATAIDWHRRQRDLVAASLIAVPGVKRSTHRHWA
jgi:hypothetical protein